MTNEDQDKRKFVIKKGFTRQQEAILDYGKNMFLKTNKTLQDFCKSMLSFTIGAIPVYLGLLKLIITDTSILTVGDKVLIFIPFIFFLGSSIIFLVGYQPKNVTFALNDITKIELARNTLYKKRMVATWLGLSIFFIGIVIVIGVSIYFLLY